MNDFFRFHWSKLRRKRVDKCLLLRKQNLTIPRFHSWTPCENLKFPKNVVFFFEINLYKCKLLCHCKSPGGLAFTVCHTSVIFHQWEASTSNMPGLVLSKQGSFMCGKRPFHQTIEWSPSSLAAKRNFFTTCCIRVRKEMIFSEFGCVTPCCVFVWGEQRLNWDLLTSMKHVYCIWVLLLVNWSLTNCALPLNVASCLGAVPADVHFV